MLSVLSTPCTNPTPCHAAASRAVRSVTSLSQARYLPSPTRGEGATSVRTCAVVCLFNEEQPEWHAWCCATELLKGQAKKI
jgi:hypothetical protein